MPTKTSAQVQSDTAEVVRTAEALHYAARDVLNTLAECSDLFLSQVHALDVATWDAHRAQQRYNQSNVGPEWGPDTTKESLYAD